MMKRLHALSIDVEEWYHPELVRDRAPAVACGRQAPEATLPILDLLDRYGVSATFFVVGETAAECPDLTREIARRGHEIGCHGYTHRALWDMTPASFARELDDYRALMQDILSDDADIMGFRAPTFSLDQRTSWAIEVLLEYNYRYDSSIFPQKNFLYGVAGAPDRPYRISPADVSRPDASGKLVEFPMTVCQWGPLRIPVSGGVYLRSLPMTLLNACLRRVEQERSFVIYAHPWETYPQTPVAPLPALSRLATYYNVRGALAKLEKLLQRYRFAPLRAVLAQNGLLD
jgi:peptidoglycan-N-acetylglucosamine deacetylase